MLKIYQLRLKQNIFEVTLKYKGVGVRVAFVDGNTYNGTPAKCYTSDPFKQLAIENSQMFKNKEIILERSVPEESDRKLEEARKAAQAKLAAKRAAIQTAAPKPAEKPAGKPAEKPAEQSEPAQEPEKPAEPENQPNPEGDASGTTTEDGTKVMVFDNVGEAILYVAQHFQQQAQTEKEAREILKANGINPRIKKG